MQLVVGSYTFAANSVDVASRIRSVRADSGRRLRYVRTLTISGWLEGDTQAALTTAEEDLHTALLSDYLTVSFNQDSGSPSAITLSNTTSISGVVVVDGPNFPGGQPGEYATLRRFDFTVEAEYLPAGARLAILMFDESVSHQGTGGPVKRWRNAVNAAPVRQIVYPSSTVRVTQSGEAIGHTRYPDIPGPLWPAFELEEQRSIRRRSPRRLGSRANSMVEYAISWSYVFEGPGPFIGLPGLPPF